MKRFALGLAVLLCACQAPPPPPTAAEIAALPKDAPAVFVAPPRASLEGLDGLYLGQPQADALKIMETMCSRFVELEGGWKRANTSFKGCHLAGHPTLYTFRVGFNPAIQNRVFTLEVKRRSLQQDLVRKRFWQHFNDIQSDFYRVGMLKGETPAYNMFADWEEGLDGPTHLLLGLTDAEVERLKSSAP